MSSCTFSRPTSRTPWSPTFGATQRLDVLGAPDNRLVPPVLAAASRWSGVMNAVEANSVTIGIEQFGDTAAPVVLCVGDPCRPGSGR